MSTQDCIAEINARLDRRPSPYDGNRKFKRLSKKRGDDGRAVRMFQDNLYTFKVIGDGPYDISLELEDDTRIPAFAKEPPPVAAPAEVSRIAPSAPSRSDEDAVGYFQEDQGKFTIVLKEFWDEEGEIDPDADLEEILPDGFYNLADASFEYEGETSEGYDALIEAGFVVASLNGKATGEDWSFGVAAGRDSDTALTAGGFLSRFMIRRDGFDAAPAAMYLPALPAEFEEVEGPHSRGQFLSKWDTDTTRAWLLDNGFVHNRRIEEGLENLADMSEE